MKCTPALMVLFLLAGCALTGIRPQKGGSATVGQQVSIASTNATKATESYVMGSVMPNATITQPENPQATSGQAVSFESSEEVSTPYDVVKTTVTEYPDGRRVTVQEPMPAGTKLVKHTKQSVEQNLGGSWKDTAREMAAALGSFAMVQYVGIAVMLFGAAGFFHPALRIMIGGKDVAMAVAGCGAVMVFGPFLFVTYSKWFFLAIVLAGVYWLLARFKYQHGLLDSLQSQSNPPSDPPAK